MTSRRKDVNIDVFSSRLVVASIAENVFARAAYGTLNDFEYYNSFEFEGPTIRLLSTHP